MIEPPRSRKESSTWNQDWITESGSVTIPRLSRKKRKECQHEWRKFIMKRRGGWNAVCQVCGKKRQNRRRATALERQTRLPLP